MPSKLGQILSDSVVTGVKTRDGVLLVTPEIKGGLLVPASPVIADLRGTPIRGLGVRTTGASYIDVWTNANCRDPQNQQAIDDAIEAGTPPPAADYTNIENDWLFLGVWIVREPGLHLEDRFTQEIRKSRYLKLDHQYGVVPTEFHVFGA